LEQAHVPPLSIKTVDSIEDGTKIQITRITTILPTLEKPKGSISINRVKGIIGNTWVNSLCLRWETLFRKEGNFVLIFNQIAIKIIQNFSFWFGLKRPDLKKKTTFFQILVFSSIFILS
jgi:hypothetical protein